jgi:tRNA1(Val) A37 N6-methylase TrmN6
MPSQVVAVERQPALLALLAHNAAAAGLAPPRLTALAADVRDVALLPRRTASLVLANPPFFVPQQQHAAAASEATERAAARHELHGGVAAFVTAAASALAPRGAAKFVLPPSRLPHLMAALEDSTRTHGYVSRRLRASSKLQRPSFALICAHLRSFALICAHARALALRCIDSFVISDSFSCNSQA